MGVKVLHACLFRNMLKLMIPPFIKQKGKCNSISVYHTMGQHLAAYRLFFTEFWSNSVVFETRAIKDLQRYLVREIY